MISAGDLIDTSGGRFRVVSVFTKHDITHYGPTSYDVCECVPLDDKSRLELGQPDRLFTPTAYCERVEQVAS